MISHQLTLIRREVWEHPAIWVTPLVLGVIIALLTLTGQVSISAFGEAVDLAIVGAQNTEAAHRASLLTGLLAMIASVFAFGAWVIMVFYSLDALYAERKDKSILFWRSLPITDAEAVISKLLTALFVIPLVSVVVVAITHVVILLLTSVWIMTQGGDAGHLVWGSARLLDTWSACLVAALLLPLWMSPFIGWFLLVSAYTKRSPLLVAIMPIAILPMLEKLLVGSDWFFQAFFVRSFQSPLFQFDEFEQLEMRLEKDGLEGLSGGEPISLLAQIDLAAFFGSPSLWLGIAVCAVFTAAAIYVRRYRDESY
jgi:ABC-2 type transport system permease protein